MADKKNRTRRKKRDDNATTGDPPTALVTTKDLSRYLNVSRSTIDRMRRAGQIPYTKMRGVYRFDVLAVRAVLARVT
jgi:excisionase family DNA binding protein